MAFQIIALAEGAPLAKHGVQERDYLLKINGQEVSSRADVRLAYPKAGAEFLMRRGTDEFTIQVDDDETGATVEDGGGEFFSLMPESTLAAAGETTRTVQLADEDGNRPTGEPTDAETAIMLVAWLFLVINFIGSLILFTQFGYDTVPSASGYSTEKVLNVELIAIMVVACLSSVFLVAFASMLCHYKRHLSNMENLLNRIADK